MSEMVQFSEEPTGDLQGGDNVQVPAENTPPPQPQTVELSAETRRAIAEESAKAFRAMQSMQDKKAKQVAEQTRKQIEALRSQGAQISPEIERNMVQQSVDQFLENEPSPAGPAQGTQPTQPGAQQQQATDPVTAMANMYLQRAGITFEPDDVEVSIIDRMTNDPDVFLASVKKAIAAKQARLARPVGSPAAAPGVVGSGGVSANHTQSYVKEMLSARGKGYSVGNAIKEKYRKLGVDVDRTPLQ